MTKNIIIKFCIGDKVYIKGLDKKMFVVSAIMFRSVDSILLGLTNSAGDEKWIQSNLASKHSKSEKTLGFSLSTNKND